MSQKRDLISWNSCVFKAGGAVSNSYHSKLNVSITVCTWDEAVSPIGWFVRNFWTYGPLESLAIYSKLNSKDVLGIEVSHSNLARRFLHKLNLLSWYQPPSLNPKFLLMLLTVQCLKFPEAKREGEPRWRFTNAVAVNTDGNRLATDWDQLRFFWWKWRSFWRRLDAMRSPAR